jgi:hypothetical protein
MRPEEVTALMGKFTAETSVAGRRDRALSSFLFGSGNG